MMAGGEPCLFCGILIENKKGKGCMRTDVSLVYPKEKTKNNGCKKLSSGLQI